MRSSYRFLYKFVQSHFWVSSLRYFRSKSNGESHKSGPEAHSKTNTDEDGDLSWQGGPCEDDNRQYGQRESADGHQHTDGMTASEQSNWRIQLGSSSWSVSILCIFRMTTVEERERMNTVDRKATLAVIKNFSPDGEIEVGDGCKSAGAVFARGRRPGSRGVGGCIGSVCVRGSSVPFLATIRGVCVCCG